MGTSFTSRILAVVALRSQKPSDGFYFLGRHPLVFLFRPRQSNAEIAFPTQTFSDLKVLHAREPESARRELTLA